MNANLTSTLSSSSIVNPPPTFTTNKHAHTITNSGASSHYLRPDDIHCATTITVEDNGPTVILSDAATITFDKTSQLHLSSKLSPTAQTVHILPGLKIHHHYR